jgi:hypothetical protein
MFLRSFQLFLMKIQGCTLVCPYVYENIRRKACTVECEKKFLKQNQKEIAAQKN